MMNIVYHDTGSHPLTIQRIKTVKQSRRDGINYLIYNDMMNFQKINDLNIQFKILKKY